MGRRTGPRTTVTTMSDPDRYHVTDVTAPRGGKHGRGRNKQGRAKPTKRDRILTQLDRASGLLARWELEPVRLVARALSGGRVRTAGEAATPNGYRVAVLMVLGSAGGTKPCRLTPGAPR
jgi:hypothetical protein